MPWLEAQGFSFQDSTIIRADLVIDVNFEHELYQKIFMLMLLGPQAFATLSVGWWNLTNMKNVYGGPMNQTYSINVISTNPESQALYFLYFIDEKIDPM